MEKEIAWAVFDGMPYEECLSSIRTILTTSISIVVSRWNNHSLFSLLQQSDVAIVNDRVETLMRLTSLAWFGAKFFH